MQKLEVIYLKYYIDLLETVGRYICMIYVWNYVIVHLYWFA